MSRTNSTNDERINAYKILVEKRERTRPHSDLTNHLRGLDRRKILNWVSKRVGCALNLSGSGYGQIAGSCAHNNESSSFIGCGEFDFMGCC
jgi:hypothetical protein